MDEGILHKEHWRKFEDFRVSRFKISSPSRLHPYRNTGKTFLIPMAEQAARAADTAATLYMTSRDFGIQSFSESNTNGNAGIAKRTISARAHVEEL